MTKLKALGVDDLNRNVLHSAVGSVAQLAQPMTGKPFSDTELVSKPELLGSNF